MNFLTNLLAGIGGSIASIVTGWQARQTARVEADVKTIAAQADIAVAQAQAAVQLAASEQASEAQWDMLVAQQMDRTWKDEWFVLLFSVPLILAFLGDWGAGVTAAGFGALTGMPDWYFWSLGAAVAASFGVRRVMTLFGSGRR